MSAKSLTWHKYRYEGTGAWWWCETSGDCFLEANPSPWARFLDPTSAKQYWWRDDSNWFWIDGIHGQVGHSITVSHEKHVEPTLESTPVLQATERHELIEQAEESPPVQQDNFCGTQARWTCPKCDEVNKAGRSQCNCCGASAGPAVCAAPPSLEAIKIPPPPLRAPDAVANSNHAAPQSLEANKLPPQPRRAPDAVATANHAAPQSLESNKLPPQPRRAPDAVAAASDAAQPSLEASKLPPQSLLRAPDAVATGNHTRSDAVVAENHPSRQPLLSDSSPMAAAWQYPLCDDRQRCFVGHLPDCISSKDSKGYLRIVMDSMDDLGWERPPSDKRSGSSGGGGAKRGVIGRHTKWLVRAGCCCSYRHEKVLARELPATPFPSWMNKLMQACMPDCGLPDPATWPNSCIINRYSDGSEAIDWHCDDEPLFAGRSGADERIITLVLGSERLYEMRPADTDTYAGNVPLSCSLLVKGGDIWSMEGHTPKHYMHRVPKYAGKKGEKVNIHLSLTWRWIVAHGSNKCVK